MTDKAKGKREWVGTAGFLAVLALFFSSVLFFQDLFTGKYLLTERDLGPYFIPPRFFWVESIKNGDFPLWNPYQFSGHPFSANPQNAIFYPLNSLFFLLRFDVAFNTIIILHFFLGGLFTYFLLRDLKANRTGSLISGLIFMLSGYLISVHSLLAILLSVIWTPLIIMFFRRAIANPGLKNEILTAIFITLSFLGGGIEIVYGNFFILLFMMIFFAINVPSVIPAPLCNGVNCNGNRVEKTGFPRILYGAGLIKSGMTKYIKPFLNQYTRVRSLFLVSVIFMFLCAVQLLPFLELFYHSIRGGGMSYQEATTWSFAPKEILLFFLPDAYGYFLDMKKYWINQCWFKTLYTGGLPFILSLIFFLMPHSTLSASGLLAGRRGENDRMRGFGKDQGFYLSLILFSLFLSLGKYNPLYLYVFKYLPFFNGIRYPVKFLYIFILILSVTAGLGFQRLTELSEEGEHRRFKNILIVLSLVSGLFLLFFVINHKVIEHFLKLRGIDFPDFNLLSVNLFHVKRSFFYLALFFLLLRIGWGMNWKGWTKILLVFFLTADLFGNMGFYGKEKTSDYFKKTDILEMISSGKGDFRIFSTPKTLLQDTTILLAAPSALDIFKEKNLPSLNLIHRLHDVWGMDVIRLRSVDDLYRMFTSTPSISTTNLIDLYSVKYVISVTPIEKDRRFELIYSRIEGLRGKKKDLLKENTIKLYRNRNPLPRAWLVKNHRVLDEKSILAILSGKEFNPRKEVLLEEEPEFNPSSPPFSKGGLGGLGAGDRSGSSLQKKKDVGDTFGGTTEIVSETNNRVLIHVKAAQNAFLILSDTYFPGWKAYVDGNRVKILRANYNFRAVSIPPGKHEVKFVYHPLSVKLGVLVTSLGIIGILVMGLWLRLKGTRRRGVPLRTPSGKGNI